MRTALPIVLLAGLACSAHAQIAFNAKTDYATPANPGAVAVADFNGDGLRDLVVTSDTPDKFSLLTATGPGVFGAPVATLTGANSGPDSIIAADLDGDGDADLAVILKNINQLRFYINNGAGVFTPGASCALGNNARGLAAADLDGDGDLDFAVYNRDDNSVTVVRRTGATLTPATFAVPSGPRGLALGDLNADGRPELLVTSRDARAFTIYVNNGLGQFAAGQTVSVGVGLRPSGIAIGDMDNDGDADVVVAVSGNGLEQLAVHRNAAGLLGAPASFNTGGLNTGGVALADFDMDGFLDAAAENSDSGNVSVLRNAGNGALGAPLVIPTGLNPTWIVATRIDANATPDLAVVNADSGTTSVLLNAVPYACSPADVGTEGSSDPLSGPDGFITGTDFDVFILAFFSETARPNGTLVADVCNDAGTPGADGFLTGADFDFFVGAFFAGCP